MVPRLAVFCTLGFFLSAPTVVFAQDDPDEDEQPQAAEPPPEGEASDMMNEDEEGGAAIEQPSAAATETPAEKPAPESAAVEEQWPFQQPLFALFAPVRTAVGIGVGYATNPDVDSLAFHLAASFAFSDMAVSVRMPLGLALQEDLGNEFNWGDMELGWKWLIIHEPEKERHLAVGMNIIGPLSRVGEEKDLRAVQSGQLVDNSNFGKRYLLAQKPLLDMGLIPRLNFGLVPYVVFGQNLGRVSLQTDIGCVILIMDNVDAAIYGTDRRLGAVLFYDLAAPVAITRELSVVAEFNAAVALEGLSGTGFAVTLGPRWTSGGISAGVGVQLPLGVDNKPPDDDKMVGRFDAAVIARHQIAVVLDVSYSF